MNATASVAAFAAVTALFFLWGFGTSLLNPVVPAMKAAFELDQTTALLTESAWFIAYGLVSLPASIFLARLGFSNAIILGLGTMLVGYLMVPLATGMNEYSLILAALFVVSSGVTLLQVAANPLAAGLGSAESSHFRLTLSQAFNSLGTIIGPALGGIVMLRGGLFHKDAHSANAAEAAINRTETLTNVNTAFLLVAGIVALLILVFMVMRKKIDAHAPEQDKTAMPWSALKSSWALYGAGAIFVYVGAEVAIGSNMISFLNQSDILGIPKDKASQILGLMYWGGAMVGRFIGSILLTRVPAGLLLAFAAIVATALCGVAYSTSGELAAYAALSVGLFNSIMFPAIFTLTLERSSAPAAATSGLLCTAIVGGAVLPLIFGRLADLNHDMGAGFIVPALAYIGVAAFALSAWRTKPLQSGPSVVAGGH